MAVLAVAVAIIQPQKENDDSAAAAVGPQGTASAQPGLLDGGGGPSCGTRACYLRGFDAPGPVRQEKANREVKRST